MPSKTVQKNIPKGWQRAKLGDISDITNGKTNSQDAVIEGEYPLFDRSVAIKRSNKYLFDNTAIILPGEGAEFVPRYYSGKFDLHQRAYAIFPKENIYPGYLYYYLYSNKSEFLKKSVGSTVRSLRLPLIQSVQVKIPPIKEQKKITEILETVDREIEKTDEIIIATEKLKKGLMQKLFTRGIGHKKFKKTKLGEIPDIWEVKTMRDICSVRQGLQIAIKNRFKDPGENRNVYITLKYLKDLENPEYIENPSKRVVCSNDDILMTRTGNTGIVITGVEGVFHNNFFLVDYDRKIIDKQFLVYYLQSEKIQKTIADKAGTTTIPDLNHGDFYSLLFLMPSKEEQKEISDILSSVDEQISVNKKLKDKLTELKKGLMQDLLSGKKRVKV